MKKFISGLLVGMIMTISCSAFAGYLVLNSKILVNGQDSTLKYLLESRKYDTDSISTEDIEKVLSVKINNYTDLNTMDFILTAPVEKKLDVGEATIINGLIVQVRAVTQQNGITRVYYTVINNTKDTFENWGVFTFKLSNPENEDKVNLKSFGFCPFKPGDVKMAYYEVPIDCEVLEVNYHLTNNGFHQGALATWVIK